MMNRPVRSHRFAAAMAAWSGILLICSGLAVGADVDATSEGSPKNPVPALLPDGSGIYRISLDRALGAAPLIVMLDVRADKIAQAVALPVHHAPVPWPVDVTALAVKNGRLTGSITVSSTSMYIKEKNKEPSPTITTQASAKIVLDAACEGATGQGTYGIIWSVTRPPLSATSNSKGQLSILRQPATPLPERYEIDIFGYAAMADHMQHPAIWLRTAMRHDAATATRIFINPLPVKPGRALPIKESKFTLTGHRLTGRVAVGVDEIVKLPFVLEFEGSAVGRQLAGTVTYVKDDRRVTTAWLGLLHDAQDWRFPMDIPSQPWTWQHDLPADPAMAKRAAEEAQKPVLPGEPGKAAFWTWRSLVRGGATSTIYPPCFGIEETPEAAKYRFTITGSGQPAREFIGEKPWHPIAPVWKDMPPGEYSLVVTPVGAAGADLPGKMRVTIIDKEAKPGTIELDKITINKRAPFSGPYATGPKSWNNLALSASRWRREFPGAAEVRFLRPMPWARTGGEGGFAWAGATELWATLASRSLTTDPNERLISEYFLAGHAECMVSHQRVVKPNGIFYGYKGYTPLSRWSAEAVMDAYLQTGDERWKKMAMDYGRALASLQRENGAFNSTVRPGGPIGFFVWEQGNLEFGASELLYTLGRLRRDCKTDEFLATERKALAWMLQRAVPDRFFPIYVHHSQSQGYPIWQHAMSALFFARYLLECAPPEARNVALAEDLCRWAEDHGVRWNRQPDGPQTGAITPIIPAGDRMSGDPSAVNLMAALTFRQLAQATGSELWRAKGGALATSVAQAVNPATGQLDSRLNSIPDRENQLRQFDDANYYGATSSQGWTIQLLREYVAAVGDRAQ